ncbi:MAG: translation initiation factor IF-2 [Verrucomicrobia bacterium]|jgi:translation initiation factor IF-2|nr:translation initiation factor IF-2 [Verrucomicrobiota bacterium]
MRVHELAKELGLSSKEMLAQLHDLGVEAKSHMSALEEDAIELIREAQGGADTAAAATQAPASEEAPAETSAAPKDEPVEAPEKEETLEAPAPEETKEAGSSESDTEEKIVRFRGGVVVRDLAEMLGVRPNQIISELMGMNVFAAISAKLDFDVAEKLAAKHGFTVEHEKRGEHQAPIPKDLVEDAPKEDRPEDLIARPPVVTFLGHVDHGKTSLLDYIRKATVAKGESGGITQHIGAYTVDMSGREITFLDTPGHAAFTAMRARGANLTDIAVIIVAADDGIMPQTKEAISHAKAAGVAIIVAINKCDLPAANPDRVLQQLQAEELAPEDWGGETICCQVSAETGEGIDHLLDMLLLQSEMLELSANPNKRAEGFVIESQLEPGMGPTAHLLVTGGTLKVGDAILCGTLAGRVRALINDHGLKVKSAKPSTPVKCLGLSGVPEAGAEFVIMKNDRLAKNAAAQAAQAIKTAQYEAPKKASLDDLFSQIDEQESLELKVLLKADTQGSVEAIVHSLNEVKSDKISLSIILSDTGNITTNDVMLASASNAVILGFHVAKESGVSPMAKHEGVEIRLHQVIYELIDQVTAAMIGVLGPRLEEVVRGQAQVRQIFEVGKGSKVAGCLVLKGIVNAKHRVRVKRKGEVLYQGALHSLKHFQDDVREVREAQECGLRLDHFTEYIEGDILEFYEIEEHVQTL